MAPRFIYHIVFLADWEQQETSEMYCTKSLDDEGFIHCSKEEQIRGTLKRFFKNRNDIRILKIDTTLLNSPLLYEAADDGSGFFPHIFGGICKSAIVDVEGPTQVKRFR
jgi:uncharacterized protein (DUF952 family)